MWIPLEMMQVQERGRIIALTGPESLTHRLREMGVREGVMIEMVRPGSPCIISIEHHRISLRVEQVSVLVELVSSAD